MNDYERQLEINNHPPGTIVEDCSYHPCEILSNNNGKLRTRSLLTGQEGGCDLFHCGIRKLDPKEVEEIKQVYSSLGTRGLLIKAGWSDEDIDNVLNEPSF